MRRIAPAAGGSAPESWLVDRNWDRWILGGSVFGFLVPYLAWFPRIYATEDDASYLAQAWAMRHGHLTLDSLHQSVVQSFVVGPHLVSQYPPGMPVLLALASFAGWNAALGVNLVVILATTGVVAYLLRRTGRPIVFAALYLLYPTAVLFSRTVMSDLLSGLVVALAIAAVIDGRPLAAGLVLGLGVLIRDANVVACATVPAGALYDMRRHSSGDGESHVVEWVLRYLAGLVPAAVAGGLTYFVTDGGQSLSHTGQFALGYLPHHLPGLVVGLVLMYPLMLFAPLVFRGAARTSILLTCYGFVVFYGAWFFQDKGSTAAETFVVSQRFLLVVLPLFVVSYADAVCRAVRRFRVDHVRRWVRGVVVTGIAMVLVLGSVAVQRADERHGTTLANVRGALLRAVGPTDLLVADKEVAKLVLPQWGSRDVYIVSDQSSAAVKQYLDGWQSRGGPPGRRVLVADWSGGGLGGAVGGDRSAAGAVTSLVPTTVLADGPLGLPADFRLLEVTGPVR